MTFKIPLVIVLSAALLQVYPAAQAEERKQEHREEHKEERREERGRVNPTPPPRPAPPRFQEHPPGGHPHGPIVRPHAIRVMSPRAVRHGEHQWRHWEHSEFSRPVYYWNWAVIRSITCIAEDSYGDQYPVTEETFSGFGLNHMTAVEDDALDRCYAESGGDQSCYLATCSHF
jgi:hypothetical protein